MKLPFALLAFFATSAVQAQHPDIRAVVPVVGANPGGIGWADSYSVGDRCYCISTFDHNIKLYPVETPLGWMTVEDVCNLLGPGPGSAGRPVYNDVQCGNGPPNDATDEHFCPGRTDIGRSGCGHIGPKWNFDGLVTPTTPAPVAPVAPPTGFPTSSPVVAPTPPTPTPPTPTPPTPTPPTPGVGTVTGFTLVNADTDQDIRALLPNNDVIDLSVVGTSALSIRADVSGSPIGSVGFGLDGNANYRTENVAVYALGGNSGTNYFPVPELAILGSHTVSATPYSSSGTNGVVGTTLSVTFDVVP